MLRLICIHPRLTATALTSLMLLASMTIGFAEEKRELDPSCKAVEETYLKSRGYPRYSVKMPLIREDGSYKPYMEYKVTPTQQLVWRSFDKRWVTYRRQRASLWDRFDPKFTNCKMVGEEPSPEGTLLHYKSTWSHFPHKADADLWVLKEDGMTRRVVRRYPDDGWALPEGTIEETFQYAPLE